MKKKVAFFGASNAARYLELLINKDEIEITSLYDNNEVRHGEKFANIIIENPNMITKNEYDIIIITSRFYEEIFSQLTNEFDIPEYKIFPWYIFLPINMGEMEYKKPFNIIDPFYLYTLSNASSIQFFSKDIAKKYLDPDEMNDLSKWFFYNEHRRIMKCSNYFEAYERHFKKYRNKKINVLEIGVCDGGSLQMWKNYFGDQANIYGVDIDPRCKQFEEDGIKIFIGDQADRLFLNEIRREIGPIDILIDDGGHEMEQQKITFLELFDSVTDDGIYLCEDLHTSYWPNHGGAFGAPGTFIEYSKGMIDAINAYHSESANLVPDKYTETIKSITYYDGMVFFEKKPLQCFSMILN